MKKYKAYLPTQTIQKIRTILNDNGLFLRENPYKNSKFFHSCRVLLTSDNVQLLNIGTGGKGITYEYALASAYAEFLERLQNFFLISGHRYATKKSLNVMKYTYYFNKIKDENLLFEYIYDAKEIQIDIKEHICSHKKFYFDFFDFLNDEKEICDFFIHDLGFDDFTSIPFYSYKDSKEIYLPIEVIHIACGSNGMASGNTKDEALIQGFCEIFERYVGRRIYYENITPPDIPLEVFKDKKIHELIVKFINETNYKVYIKDCSLDQELPVLGVLVIDEQNGKYNFNLGSALNPEIALERCFTEIYQNPVGIYWLDMKLEDHLNKEKFSDEYVYINGNMIFNCSSGYWPLSLFRSASSYEYKKLNVSLNISDKLDLKFIVDKITELGFDIYIRDVSFLGFPSYYIVIPGMSQYPNAKSHYTLLGSSVNLLKKIRDIKSLNEKEVNEICEKINKDYEYFKIINYRVSDIFLYNSNQDLLELDLELLFFMLNYRVGNLDKSLYYMNEYLRNKDFEIYSYYYGIKDYVELRKDKYLDLEIKYILEKKYGEDIDEIIQDMSDKSKIFDNYDWPTCFHCEKCTLIKDCRYFNILAILKRIQNIQKEYVPDYKNILN